MKKEEIADILTTAADFVFLSLDEQGNILTANPAIRKVFAKQEGEIEGSSLTNLIPGIELVAQIEYAPVQARGGIDSFDNEVELGKCDYLEALAALTQQGERYNTVILANSEERWIELETYKVLHDGKIIFTLVINDITRRKRQEKEIKALNESLEHKVQERTANLESRTEQIKKVVNTCRDELQAINDTYQNMKERQMDIMEKLESQVIDGVVGLTPQQSDSIQANVKENLINCMNIYSEDQITDQKFLMAIITLNELFSGETIEQQNLKPGQLSGTSQHEVDDLLDSLGI